MRIYKADDVSTNTGVNFLREIMPPVYTDADDPDEVFSSLETRVYQLAPSGNFTYHVALATMEWFADVFPEKLPKGLQTFPET